MDNRVNTRTAENLSLLERRCGSKLPTHVFYLFCRLVCIAAVIVCLWRSNFCKRTRQFICCFIDGQDSHNTHSYHYHHLFRYLENHLLINLLTPQVFRHQSGTAKKLLLKNCQCESKLTLYLQPERYKNKVGTKGN